LILRKLPTSGKAGGEKKRGRRREMEVAEGRQVELAVKPDEGINDCSQRVRGEGSGRGLLTSKPI